MFPFKKPFAKAVLVELTVSEAIEFFDGITSITRILKIMEDIGLGYIKLGQPSTTLSGGEAQRIKLASELHKISTGNTLYILDEPTTGLHFEDIKKLSIFSFIILILFFHSSTKDFG